LLSTFVNNNVPLHPQNKSYMEERISQLEKLAGTLNQELTNIKELLAHSLTKVDSNFNSIIGQLITLNKKVDFLTKKVDLLEGTTNDGLGDVGVKLENLTEEISKIGVVTQYTEQFENLKGFTSKNN